jgi:hypothetical protein
LAFGFVSEPSARRRWSSESPLERSSNELSSKCTTAPVADWRAERTNLPHPQDDSRVGRGIVRAQALFVK